MLLRMKGSLRVLATVKILGLLRYLLLLSSMEMLWACWSRRSDSRWMEGTDNYWDSSELSSEMLVLLSIAPYC
jgi:hypothetical protein